jgi:hypothetical protein
MERWKRSIRHAQPHDQRGREHVKRLRAVHWTGYVASLLAVVLASAGAGLARYLLGDVNISLIYLVIVVGVAPHDQPGDRLPDTSGRRPARSVPYSERGAAAAEGVGRHRRDYHRRRGAPGPAHHPADHAHAAR